MFDDRPASGVGRRARSRSAGCGIATTPRVTRHAHGYVPQTLADLGIVGLALTSALLVAWLVAALRATGLHPRRLPCAGERGRGSAARRDWDGERIAFVAVALVPVVFGAAVVRRLDLVRPGTDGDGARGGGIRRGPRAARRAGGTAPCRVSVAPPARLASPLAVADAAHGRPAWPGPIWQPEASDQRDGRRAARSPSRHRSTRRIARRRRTRRTPIRSRPTRCSCEPRSTRRGADRPRATSARAGRDQVPGRSPDLVPAGRLPAGHAGSPERALADDERQRSTSTRTR